MTPDRPREVFSITAVLFLYTLFLIYSFEAPSHALNCSSEASGFTETLLV